MVQELTRASPVAVSCIRTVERHFARWRTVNAVVGVKRFAAPVVVGLRGRRRRLVNIGRARSIVANDEDHVALRSGTRCELGQVNTCGPVGLVGRLRDRDTVRLGPVAFDEAGGWVGLRGGLFAPCQRHRTHQPSACAAIPAHPVNGQRVRWRATADEEADGLSPVHAGVRCVALDRGGA